MHALGLIGYAWGIGWKQYQKSRRTRAEDWETFLVKYNKMSHQTQALLHSVLAGEYTKESELESALQEMETLLQNQRTKKLK